jgi:hypothetical protein
VSNRFERLAPLVTAGACTAVFCLALAFGSRTASGADSLGYVSQAYLWRDGSLHVEHPLFGGVPWPHAPLVATPLGFRPGDNGTVVPSYPAGVPLIMAALLLVVGSCGPYLVSPLFGVLLVSMTYVLGRRLSGRAAVGATAALFMASSPAFLFNVMWPMSDTVTAALWTASLAVLTWPGRRAAIAGGVLAGAAILARPNLFPLAGAGALAALLWPGNGWRNADWRRAFLYGLSGAVPAAMVVALLNDSLYGSPLLSGYGPAQSLYAASFLWPNVKNYVTALLRSEVFVLWLLALPVVPALRAQPAASRPAALPAVVFVALVGLSYLLYLPFAEWWYLRFLLPAFPLLFVAASAGFVALLARARRPIAVAALGIALLLMVVLRVQFAGRHHAFTVGAGEDRYLAVARFVDRALAPGSVLLSMQHSGSLWFYSGRATLRYDFLTPERLPSAIEWLKNQGLHPYIVLDASEEEAFKTRFSAVGPLGQLDLRVVGEMRQPVPVRIFDAAAPANPREQPFQIQPTGQRSCPGPSPAWRRFVTPFRPGEER